MNWMINDSRSCRQFWLTLSFTFAMIYSFLAMKEAFSAESVIQDDARQHVFWTLRFLEADLFPNDLNTEHTLRLVSAIAGAMPFVILIAALIEISQKLQGILSANPRAN